MQLSDQDFNYIVKLFRDKFGINLSQKRILVENRLMQTIRSKGLTSFKEYIDLVNKDKSDIELTNLINKLTTNHTYFLREKEHYDFLKQVLLPYFEKNRPTKTLRIWSAGCSSGEEAYTTAMVIDEYFGMRKAGWDTTILASDISQQVLVKAKAATYPGEALNDLPDTWKRSYFVKNADGTVTVADKIKKEVVFKTINLMDNFTFPKPFDLIMCRNVMIYFEEDTKIKLVKKFANYIANDGYLYVGHSESINRLTNDLTMVKPAIYKKGR